MNRQRLCKRHTFQRRHRRDRLLRLESLEDRRLLAVLTVTSLEDSGSGTLREAVASANALTGADVIDFDPALDGQTIELSSSELLITDAVSIVAETLANGITINATAADPTPGTPDGAGIRIFNIPYQVAENFDVRLVNLTLTGGDVRGNGGAIRSRQNLAVIDSEITGNSAFGGKGGGIYSERQYDYGIRASVDGYSSDFLTVSHSTISGNHASGEGGGVFLSLYQRNAVIQDSMITGNSASAGGGIRASVGGIFYSSALTVSHSTISGNHASGEGGGVFLSGSAVIQDSMITGNSASRGGGIRAPLDYFGALTLSDSTISGNHASGAGGGVSWTFFLGGEVLADAITISDNFAGTHGGGLEAFWGGHGGAVTLRDSLVSANTATTSGGGASLIAFEGTISVSRCSISNNVASDAGGGIRMIASASSLVDILDSTVTGNRASNGGGLSVISEHRLIGGGDVRIDRTHISGNSASVSGGGIDLKIRPFGFASIHASTISGNFSPAGGGAYLDVYGGRAVVDASTISGNSAHIGGGLQLVLGRANDPYFAGLDVVNSTISGNMSSSSGGGIATSVVAGTHLNIDHCTVVSNVADADGTGGLYEVAGGIHADGTGSPHLSHTIVGDNTRGAALVPDDAVGTIVAEYSLFESNTAGGNITGAKNLFGLDPQVGPLAANGGPTLTHRLLPSSPAVDSGDPNFMPPPNFDQRRAPFARLFGGRIDIGAFEDQPIVVDGDFNDDSLYDCLDIDALVAEIAAATNGLAFDLTSDGLVNLSDRDAWLAEAGEINLGSGKVYLLGDATLDGIVDGQDFIKWNDNKFTNTAAWCTGDFNADGIVDGFDFLIWNENKFQSSDGANQIALPMPADGLRQIEHVRHVQVNDEPIVGASSVSPQLAPLTVRRIDSVFAMSRRDVDEVDEPSTPNSFENLGDAVRIYPCVL